MECFGQKPCWVSDRGIWTLILFRTILSIILDTVLSEVIGLYDAGSVGGLSGFKIVIILPFLQMAGMALFANEKLAISFSASISLSPMCFRCMLVMPSSPADDDFLLCLIFSVRSLVVKIAALSSGNFPPLLTIALSDLHGGKWLILV